MEVLDHSDLEYLPESAVPVVASIGAGNGVAQSVLPQLVASEIGHDSGGYCWFAGEASAARTVRKHLRHELGWDSDQLDVTGYWRRDSTEWEEFDEALERAGL